MYGIFTYIDHKNQLNVGQCRSIYQSHGSYGIVKPQKWCKKCGYSPSQLAFGCQVWKRSELLDSTEPATKHEEIQPQDYSKRSGKFHKIWICTVYIYIYVYIYIICIEICTIFWGIGSEYPLFCIYLHLFTIGWLVLGCKLIQAHPVLSGLFPIYNCPEGKGKGGRFNIRVCEMCKI